MVRLRSLTEMRPHWAEVSTRRDSRWSAVFSWMPITTVTEFWRDTTSGETHVQAFDDRRVLLAGPLVRVPQPSRIVARPRPAGGSAPPAPRTAAASRAPHAVTESQYRAMPGVAIGRAEWL